jgi:hypothetical protein
VVVRATKAANGFCSGFFQISDIVSSLKISMLRMVVVVVVLRRKKGRELSRLRVVVVVMLMIVIVLMVRSLKSRKLISGCLKTGCSNEEIEVVEEVVVEIEIEIEVVAGTNDPNTNVTPVIKSTTASGRLTQESHPG